MQELAGTEDRLTAEVRSAVEEREREHRQSKAYLRSRCAHVPPPPLCMRDAKEIGGIYTTV